MRWVKVFAPFSVIPLLILLGYGFLTDPRLVPSPLVGREAPAFTIPLLEGGELSLHDLRGETVVVNFWAPWCYPACWNESPRLEAAWQRYKDQGLIMVGIVYQDSPANARDFIRRFGKSYPNGMDPRNRIAIEYGLYGVPETFFIDREGRIAYKHIGEIDMETLVSKIGDLLGAPWGTECNDWINFTFGKVRAKGVLSPTTEVRSWLGKAGAFLREAKGLCGNDDTTARAKFNEAWDILGQLNR